MTPPFTYSTFKYGPRDWRVIRLYPNQSWEPVCGGHLKFKRLSEALARVAEMNDQLQEDE